MSETAAPRRILHLTLEGFSADKLPAPSPEDATEIFPLTEANAAQALEKIFAANTVAVWTKLSSA
jgi:hypothetical protein